MKTMNFKTLKASKKMQNSIARVEKRFGEMEKDYFVEHDEENRVGRGFYDGCQLTSHILQNINIVVAHDGTIQGQGAEFVAR